MNCLNSSRSFDARNCCSKKHSINTKLNTTSDNLWCFSQIIVLSPCQMQPQCTIFLCQQTKYFIYNYVISCHWNFLNPLKTSEKLWISDTFRRNSKRPVARNGLNCTHPMIFSFGYFWQLPIPLGSK